MGKGRTLELEAKDPSVPIQVTFDTSELQRLQRLFPEMEKAVRNAYVRTLKRATKSGEVFAGRRYRESYPSVPLRLLREKYLWSKVVLNDDIAKTGAILQIKGGGVLLEHFKAKATKTGVSWQAKSGRLEIKGGFYAKVFSSNKEPHWFKRIERTRFPVRFLFGPSPASVFNKPEPQKELTDHILDRINTELPAQLSYYMNKVAQDVIKSI